MRDAIAVLAAFLCGTVPFGLFLVWATRGVDVRRVGSGNIGATNAARAAGPAVGIAVLALDALKGCAGVWLGRAIVGPDGSSWIPGALVAAPVFGHCFTPWLRFRGGKGVATALGALAVTDLRLFAVAALGFLVVTGPVRIVSAGSLAAAALVAAAAFWWYRTGPVAWGVLAVALVVAGRHHENIRRLLAGTEPRIGAGRHRRSQQGENPQCP